MSTGFISKAGSKDKLLNPSNTIFATVITVLFVAAVMYALVSLVALMLIPNYTDILTTGSYAWLFNSVFFLGFLVLSIKLLKVSYGKIPTGWQAIRLRFGERMRKKQYNEGEYLIVGRYQDFEVHDTRDLHIDMEPISVSVKGVNSTKTRPIRIELLVDSTIFYEIVDLYVYLDVKDFLGQLKSSKKSVLSNLLENQTETEAFLGKEELGNDVAKKLRENACAKWGVNITDVKIGDMDHADKELKKAQSDLRLAEINNDKTIKNARAINKAAKIVMQGMNVDDLEGLTIVGTDRGTQTLHENRVSGNGSDLTKLGAIIADAIKGG